MDIFTLLEGKLDEIASVQSLLENNDYVSIYEKYDDVLKELLFVESLDEFNDFLEEQGDLETEAFLLALASKRNICCSIGMYESNVPELLLQYLQNTSQITINTNVCNDVYEFLVTTLSEMNQLNCKGDKRYMLLLDATYCEGVFYIFYVSGMEGLEEWSDTHIERIV
ncbi:MAG: hypothetical protein IKK33_11735 [Lachnospiraceae bacterium]|nr:hypothetical protein [Lachnospiraceae bacterium]